ncbi:Uncharacterized protein Adt_21258 [Abeliophyllum distichum]|uniref:Uncharacterized protein n=1 Tax=Abeliophyllum distichum TaxID=126358 RepID=A0ABD1SYW1_9LAMI
MSGRDELIIDPIDKVRIQCDDEVIESPKVDTNIDKNITIPIDATFQDPPLLRLGQRVIRKPSRYLLLKESKQTISAEQVEDLTFYKEIVNNVDADLWKQAMNTKI